MATSGVRDCYASRAFTGTGGQIGEVSLNTVAIDNNITSFCPEGGALYVNTTAGAPHTWTITDAVVPLPLDVPAGSGILFRVMNLGVSTITLAVGGTLTGASGTFTVAQNTVRQFGLVRTLGATTYTLYSLGTSAI